jgi:RNA polymerase sigma-70 factor (ECF subfamily)
MSLVEERMLIWKLRRGSGEALSRIYKEYRRGMLKVAVAMLGDVGAAEDAVQEVFVRFAVTGRRLRLKGSLKGYLMVSVANQARNVLRSQRVRESAGLEEAGQEASRTFRPEAWVIGNEQLELLRGAMQGLAYEQREAVMLRVEGGLRFREIGKVQGVSTQTAQARYRYGVEKLRAKLNGEVRQ